jgi:signal peptidase I
MLGRNLLCSGNLISKMKIGKVVLYLVILLIVLSVIPHILWMAGILYQMPTDSMRPTIRKGDWVISDPLLFRASDLKRGDLVWAHPNPTGVFEGSANRAKDVYCQRIIGLPDDTLRLEANRICLGSVPLSECRPPINAV